MTIARVAGVMVIGGVLVWGGYVTGADFGREDGFLEGCRAIAVLAACERAEDLGHQIRVARELALDEGLRSIAAAAPSGSKRDTGQMDQLCKMMREEVSPGVAIHYGCPGAAP